MREQSGCGFMPWPRWCSPWCWSAARRGSPNPASRSPNGGRSWARCRRSARRNGRPSSKNTRPFRNTSALNQGMSLEAFKTIYWWEWTHRLLGRVIGAAFLLPFLWFLWRGWVGPGLRGRLWFIFGLGALQGAVGWWMVASGLADRIEVSQYRLATHLVLACVIYVALIWTAQRLGERPAAPLAVAHPHKRVRLVDPGARANLSRRPRRRTARRLHLQHLAADRRRVAARYRAAFF